MADRRLRYPLLWLAFVIVMICGAALISSDNAVVRGLGLAIFVVPLLVFGLLGLVYYLIERYRANRESGK